MPKSKEFVESDDSDSGSSSGSEKKGKKRQKKETKQKEAKGGSSSKKSKSDDEEPTWDLGDKCKLTIREFKGKMYIDIRHMYEDKDGDLKPSKKGISLTPKLWRNFMEVVEEVDKTVKEKC